MSMSPSDRAEKVGNVRKCFDRVRAMGEDELWRQLTKLSSTGREQAINSLPLDVRAKLRDFLKARALQRQGESSIGDNHRDTGVARKEAEAEDLGDNTSLSSSSCSSSSSDTEDAPALAPADSSSSSSSSTCSTEDAQAKGLEATAAGIPVSPARKKSSAAAHPASAKPRGLNGLLEKWRKKSGPLPADALQAAGAPSETAHNFADSCPSKPVGVPAVQMRTTVRRWPKGTLKPSA